MEEPEEDPERAALRDSALARATRDVRMVKTVHLVLVLAAMIVLAARGVRPDALDVAQPSTSTRWRTHSTSGRSVRQSSRTRSARSGVSRSSNP